MIWTEMIGAAAGILAVTGVLLNNHQNRACFALWWISNLASAALHIHAGLWALTARDLVFFGLAVVGWFVWSKKREAAACAEAAADSAERAARQMRSQLAEASAQLRFCRFEIASLKTQLGESQKKYKVIRHAGGLLAERICSDPRYGYQPGLNPAENTKRICRACRGTGTLPADGMSNCPACQGIGEVHGERTER